MADISDDKTLVKPMTEPGLGRGPGQEFVPYLVVAEGPRQGTRFPLRTGENVGGRLPSSDISLEDQSVSRQHFTVTRGAAGITISDNQSKNGTFVNGQAIGTTVTVGHGDIVQAGIYALRVVTRSIAPEEEIAPLPAEYEGRTALMEEPLEPGAETATTDGTTAPEREPGPTDQVTALEIREDEGRKVRPRWRRWAFVAGVVAVAAALGVAAYWRFGGRSPTPPVAIQPTAPKAPLCPPGHKPVEPLTDPVQCVPEIPKPRVIPLFLDFAANPLPAAVRFEGKDYGLTPVKVNAQLEVGKAYTADATFRLEEVQEELTQHHSFTITQTDTAIPILFRGPIGVIKVLKLPRDVELVAQGYFAHDQFRPRTMTLTSVAYGKPIYVPYGRYVVELRAPKPIGEGGAVVSDIRYRREIFLTEDAPAQAIEVGDEDLTQFPVEIKSLPDRADVFIDTKPVGKTPFAGLFPLGEHTLTLRKEGYFEYTEQLKNDINLLYQREITLKTTPAGDRINEGQALLLKGMLKEAVAKLSEAFQQNPLPVETAKAQYLLGTAFLGMNDLATAQGYFDQAKGHPEYELQSKLGLVNIFNSQGKKPEALTMLVEVMLKATDEAIKTEAANTFKLVSPLKSVLYVHSDPPGATVSFNDQPVSQKTPLILSDLGLGNYRLRIQKDGYEPQDLSMNLSVNEFSPVIVKLKPIAK